MIYLLTMSSKDLVIYWKRLRLPEGKISKQPSQHAQLPTNGEADLPCLNWSNGRENHSAIELQVAGGRPIRPIDLEVLGVCLSRLMTEFLLSHLSMRSCRTVRR